MRLKAIFIQLNVSRESSCEFGDYAMMKIAEEDFSE